MHSKKLCLLGFLFFALLASVAYGEQGEEGSLYPVTKPYREGDLKVSSLHTIHYMLFGNPKAKPIFVLHGGPGFGCYPRLMQYFNPEKFHIILHDQRGSGRSQPLGELRENTTPNLVEDIEKLRKFLKIEGKIFLFGGSWGSTLALAYAETYPENVCAMILRGIFTGTEAEVRNLVGGEGPRLFFPEALARMEAALPTEAGGFNPKSLHALINSEDKALARKVIDAWVKYSVKIGTLYAPPEKVEQGFGDWNPFPPCRIDCHYMMNKFFFKEKQLLEGAGKIRDIPVTIINGRYDMICPPVTACRLHKALPGSKLVIVEEAGHSEGEEGTTQALLHAVAELEEGE